MTPELSAEVRQSHAESHLAAIVEASEDAIISKTLDGHVLTWNAAAERVYGYPAAEARGRHMSFLLPPDRPDEEKEILERIGRGERVDHFETVRVRKDGQRIDVSITISPIRDPDGTVIGASHIARDITPQKRSEALLRESEAKLRAFLESASQGIVAVDEAGRIELANAKLEEIFGYNRAEMIGMPLEMLLPERHRNVHIQHRALYFANPRARAMGAGLELTGRRKDGSECPVEIGLSFVASKDGALAIAFINDITERKRVEQQLRHTQKLESLGVLAGGVAHDFNNLLTGILGNTSLALECIPEDHPAQASLRHAVAASERAADLTKQLLAYAGKGRFVTGPTDVSKLIREIGDLIQTSIPKSVELRFELAKNLPPIEADASQIQQLIMNLVINGAEAIGDGRNGTVLITTGVEQVDDLYIQSLGGADDLATGTYIVLEVHDNGCGMDGETLARIFDPFFTTKFTGRGLGLAAAQGIVRGHKGILKVYSQPNRGSTFRVLLPVTERREAETPVRPGREILAGRGTILVIDDEQVVRQAARSMLERYGYHVLLAENGKEALDLFRVVRNSISLVVLDMTMPVMSGEETLRQLRLLKPEVAVVLSSGYNEAEAIRRFTGEKLAGFIQKPYSANQLAKLIKQVMGRADAANTYEPWNVRRS